MRNENIGIIEIHWDSSNSLDLPARDNETNYGLYQIYGTHSVLGPDSLLYIGRATNQKFADRFAQHSKWIEREHSNLTYYFGRIGGITQPKDDDWTKEIDIAEKLLIFNCSPPYNTLNISDYGVDIKNTLVLNFGKRHRLPFEVSTFRNDTDYWDRSKWKTYEYKKG